MLISKTPYRVSLFGGGTDYPAWFSQNGGAFLSMSINKYCYIYARPLPPFFDYTSRIVWSKIEKVNSVSEISHPAIREALKMEQCDNIEIHHIADLPARSGLGSSSSFSVGLLNVLKLMKNRQQDKKTLAQAAINLERNILSEAGGIQDQIAAAHGGFNFVEINNDGSYELEKINLDHTERESFENSLLLVFSGLFRNSYELASEQTNNISKSISQLKDIQSLAYEARRVLQSSSFVKPIGQLLNETWLAKRSISKNISNNTVDEIYNSAIAAGAYGGKLLGAGAGGFMIFVVPENNMKVVKAALSGLITLPIKISNNGSVAYTSSHEKVGEDV